MFSGRKVATKDAPLRQKGVFRGPHLSCIERATSITSLEVLMKLALALDTTPNEFLVGSVRHECEEWRSTAELLRDMDPKQLQLARSFLLWLSAQKLP